MDLTTRYTAHKPAAPMTHRHLEGALTIREPTYQSEIELEAYVRNRHPRDIHTFEPVLACARVRSAANSAEDESVSGGSDAAAAREGTVASDYGADYYGHYAAAGISYERSPFWLDFFGKIADRLIEDFHPKTALDAGCAIGLLVEALRDRGVDAEGIDFSDFAIAQAREDIRPFLTVGSITEPFSKHYDLITCFEVVEHMPPHDADRAIANMCSFTDEVILTSTPMHYRDPTHTNIHPQEFWTERFARHGFIRDVDYDGAYIAPWAARYQRSSAPIHRVVADYDRAYSRMLHELQERNAVVVDQMRQLTELQARLDALEGRMAWSERRSVQLALKMDGAVVKAAPQGTSRRRFLVNALRRFDRITGRNSGS
jgi:SAM-dependent methyltransferase